MKSLATILLSVHLLLAGLMPHADVHELGKLPNLVAHFLEHKTDTNASLTGFLAIHYGSTEGEHQDDSHGELPFQDHHHAWHSHAFLPAPAAERTAIRLHHKVKEFSLYTISHYSEYPSAVFQPPKV